MAPVGIVLSGAAALAAAATFAYTAYALSRRPVSVANRRAAAAFTLWWALLAVQTANDGARQLIGLQAAPDEGLFLALVRLKIVAAAAALAAMTYYILWLWDRPRLAALLPAPLALAHGGLFLYLFERRLPARIEVGEWTTRLVLEQTPLASSDVQLLALVLFFAPSIVFAFAYLALWFRVDDRTSRARLGGIAVALLVFHLAAIFQYDPERGDNSFAPLLSLATALAAAIVLLVYRPPSWAQRRWRIDPVVPAGAPGYRMRRNSSKPPQYP